MITATIITATILIVIPTTAKIPARTTTVKVLTLCASKTAVTVLRVKTAVSTLYSDSTPRCPLTRGLSLPWQWGVIPLATRQKPCSILSLVSSTHSNKKTSYPHTKPMPPAVSRMYPTTSTATISRKTGKGCLRRPLLPHRPKSTQRRFSTCWVCVPTSLYAKISTYLSLRPVLIPSTNPKPTHQKHSIVSILSIIIMSTTISKTPMTSTCKLSAKDLTAAITAAGLTTMLILTHIPRIPDSLARASALTSFQAQERPHHLSKEIHHPCLPHRTFLQPTVSCISASGLRKSKESRLHAVPPLPIVVLFKST